MNTELRIIDGDTFEVIAVVQDPSDDVVVAMAELAYKLSPLPAFGEARRRPITLQAVGPNWDEVIHSSTDKRLDSHALPLTALRRYRRAVRDMLVDQEAS